MVPTTSFSRDFVISRKSYKPDSFGCLFHAYNYLRYELSGSHTADTLVATFDVDASNWYSDTNWVNTGTISPTSGEESSSVFYGWNTNEGSMDDMRYARVCPLREKQVNYNSAGGPVASYMRVGASPKMVMLWGQQDSYTLTTNSTFVTMLPYFGQKSFFTASTTESNNHSDTQTQGSNTIDFEVSSGYKVRPLIFIKEPPLAEMFEEYRKFSEESAADLKFSDRKTVAADSDVVTRYNTFMTFIESLVSDATLCEEIATGGLQKNIGYEYWGGMHLIEQSSDIVVDTTWTVSGFESGPSSTRAALYGDTYPNSTSDEYLIRTYWDRDTSGSDWPDWDWSNVDLRTLNTVHDIGINYPYSAPNVLDDWQSL